ncbi:MAG: cob(I)yrinic acid a,c-diamide adenosyltransferase [Fibromonadales bacterium]|nr:cob(I)yrinic acid a,c-diamide adenosyltransferase [Fibromonadales bacterium]
MYLSKIYTRTGDGGSTSLIGGERISKSHLRLECYGTIDELNAFTGKLKILCKESYLNNIQKTLFDIGSILASSKEWNGMPSISQANIKELEDEIDKMNSELKPLKEFTIPGENEINAEAHICRVVCRRAERILCSAKENGIAIDDFVMAYINRLSDYFFVLSRYAEHLQGKSTAKL